MIVNKCGILEDKLRDYYEDVDPTSYRQFLAEAIRKYEGKEFWSVLDIGAGIGTFLESIKPFGFLASGVEASDYGLERCKSKGLAVKPFVLQLGNPLPFDNDSISFVLMNQVIEHLDKQAGAYYISELVRILEPGGVAMINSPARNCRIWNTDPHHVYCWAPNELKKEVEKHNGAVRNIKLERVPLEPWMLLSYNEKIINNWHKNIKHPKIKNLGSLLFRIVDRMVMGPLGLDSVLAVSNVSFVKCNAPS